jgi:hypothetical protein
MPQFREPAPDVPVVGLELESFLNRLREPFRRIWMMAPKIKGSKTNGSDPAISIVVVEPADPGREPTSIEPVRVPSNDPFTMEFSPLGVGVPVAASTFTFNGGDAKLVLPAVFVAFAVKLWVAFDSSVVVKFQTPLAFAFAVPICVGPSNMLIVLPTSAVPFNVRMLALVI